MCLVQCDRCSEVIPEGVEYRVVDIHREVMQGHVVTVTDAYSAYTMCEDCFLQGWDVEVVLTDRVGEFRLHE